MKLDTGRLGVLLKARGIHMSRSKYQRPEVHLWIGNSGEKFWKAEWRVYIEGRPKPKHRAQTWPCSKYSKGAAQEQCDRLVREETGGALKPDGNVTVGEFWKQVYWPIAARRLAENTKLAYQSAWQTHVEPDIGKLQLQHVVKHSIESVLGKMADAGRRRATIATALTVIQNLFTEAAENDYITKSPCRHIEIPNCPESQETCPLTEDEVHRLFNGTTGRDRLVWRLLMLTGMRIGELLALRKSDITGDGLLVNKSVFRGEVARTKTGKPRTMPIPLPQGLREEIQLWAAGVDGEALFPSPTGRLLARGGNVLQDILGRGRKASGRPDLTFRTCRTTFATLFEGDLRDVQAILGHSTLAMTMRVYRKPLMERQRASVEELEARLTGKVVEIKKRA